jgi:hypothetical protein
LEVLSTSLALLTRNDDANPIEVGCSQWPNSTEPISTEVDSTCGGFREVGGLEPVKEEYKCLIAKRYKSEPYLL